MWALVLVFLFIPKAISAACGTNADPTFDMAVSQGDYITAFDRVAQGIGLTPEEKAHFKIVQGFSQSHDDRHGQADPETMDLYLDPELFVEGEAGACQGVVHELTHLHQFQRDHKRLHAYFSTHPPTKAGWEGCEPEDESKSALWEQDAYDCLQDNQLASHAAAMDIEAVTAQIKYAQQEALRGEDLNYLIDHLHQWISAQAMIADRSNESYYLPGIKKEDIRIFCQGIKTAQQQSDDKSLAGRAWETYCRR